MKVRPTNTGSDGTGYYRGSNGKMYYGNPQNGYLKETIEERNKRLRQQAANASKTPSAPQSGSPGLLGMMSEDLSKELSGGLFSGRGWVIGKILGFIVATAMMGIATILGLIGGVIAAAIGIVFVWGKGYSSILGIYGEFGVNLETIILTLPTLLSLVVLVVLLVRTFTKHKQYAWHLLIIYAILFLPYAFLQCGGMQALTQGFIMPSDLFFADLNTAGSLGLFPAIALFIFHKLDMKVRAQKQLKQQQQQPTSSNR